MDDHELFHFSAMCQTPDLAVLHCLRALCHWAERHPKRQIVWGGTTEASWRKSGQLTLRFTSPSYRQNFIVEAGKLLKDRWTLVETSDNNPAKPKRRPH